MFNKMIEAGKGLANNAIISVKNWKKNTQTCHAFRMFLLHKLANYGVSKYPRLVLLAHTHIHLYLDQVYSELLCAHM